MSVLRLRRFSKMKMNMKEKTSTDLSRIKNEESSERNS
jgi:hypothetical protein